MKGQLPLVARASPSHPVPPSWVVEVEPFYLHRSQTLMRHQDEEDNERSLNRPLPPVAGILTPPKRNLQTFLIYKKQFSKE